MDYGLKEKCKITKLLGKKQGKNLQYLVLSREFLDLTLKAWHVKGKWCRPNKNLIVLLCEKHF